MKIFKITVFLLFSTVITSSQVWINQVNPSPGVLFSVHAYSATTAWVSGELGKVLYTSNGGTNWINRSNAVFGTSNVLSVHAVNPATALVICNINGGKVFKTIDQGFGWQTAFSRTNATLCDIQFLDANTGFVFGNPIGNRFFIIKTTNAGSTFDTVSVTKPVAISVNSQLMTNSTYLFQAGVGGPISIWFGTNEGLVYHSNNTGATWDSTVLQAFDPVLSVTFINQTTGFAGNQDPFRTVNAGTGWVLQNSFPNTGKFFAFDNIAGHYFYSSGPSIYHSTNAGGSFTLQFTNSSKEDFRDLSFVTSPGDMTLINGWGVTGDGVIVHYTEPIGIIPISTTIPEKFSLYQNYPNPFNPVTTINFDIAEKSNVKLEVSDVLGKRVQVLYDGILKAGSYKTEFDGSSLPSGIYFYRLYSEGFTLTRKLVMIK